MPSLNAKFKKEIKSILLDHYDIVCYKVTDITNYGGGATLLIYSLHCTTNNEQFTLYLQIHRHVDLNSKNNINFDVLAQPDSVDRIKVISKLCLIDELNSVFNNVAEIFNQLGINLTFTTHKNPILMINGECSFVMDTFKILNYDPVLYTYLEICAYSMGIHSQRKVCDFSIHGHSLELLRTSIDLNIPHDMMTDETNTQLTEKFFKIYMTLLKERSHYLDDISIDDIKQASFDDLKNMVTVFKMALI